MTEPDPLAVAIQTELRRQGVLFECDGPADLSRLMMNTGEAADLAALCSAIRAALQAKDPPHE